MRRSKFLALALALMTPLLAGAPSGSAHPTSPFRVGAAVVNVSPSRLVDLSTHKVCLGGFDLACARRAFGEREEMYARAIVIESGGERVAMATSSNIGLFAKYKDGFGAVGAHDVRRAASHATGIPTDAIVVTSDHSHSSPDVEGIWGGTDLEYMRLLADGLVRAITRANLLLEEAELWVGSSTYAERDPDPLTNHWEGTGGPLDQIDRELRVLQARRPADGSIIATMVNFAAHASVLDEDTLASGDWTGEFANRFARRHGGVAMSMVGALGGIGARYSPSEFEDFLRFVGRLTRTALGRARRIDTEGVAAARTFIREPVTAPLLYGSYAPLSAQDPNNPLQVSIDRAVTPPWSTGNVMGTFVSAFRIGDVLIGNTPGEAYPDISFALSRGVQAREHFLFGLADDQVGYLISPAEGVPTAAANGAAYPVAGNDNFALSVSPTIGDHVSCSLLDMARALRFHVARESERCWALTAADGILSPE